MPVAFRKGVHSCKLVLQRCGDGVAERDPVPRALKFVYNYSLVARVSGGMVDTLVLGASAARHGGSSPLSRTNIKTRFCPGFYIGLYKRLNCNPKAWR